MANYIPYNLNQTTMVVINFADQLQPGTFEYALAYLIDRKIDLSLFDEEVVLICEQEGLIGRVICY